MHAAGAGLAGHAGDRQACGPLESHLRACVHDYLHQFLYDSALFLCERLVAECPSEVRGERCRQLWEAPNSPTCLAMEGCRRTPARPTSLQENTILLARCHIAMNQPQRAYHVLQGGWVRGRRPGGEREQELGRSEAVAGLSVWSSSGAAALSVRQTPMPGLSIKGRMGVPGRRAAVLSPGIHDNGATPSPPLPCTVSQACQALLLVTCLHMRAWR